jgi:hypothetical protein
MLKRWYFPLVVLLLSAWLTIRGAQAQPLLPISGSAPDPGYPSLEDQQVSLPSAQRPNGLSPAADVSSASQFAVLRFDPGNAYAYACTAVLTAALEVQDIVLVASRWGENGTVPPTLATLAVTPTISVSDFANYRVFQRDIGGISKSVTVSGTYSNMNWSRVEARLLQHGTDMAVLDWATIDSTPGGGTFSGNLTVPQGGWYNIEVRAVDGLGSVIGSSRGTNKWGVGMIILCIGQSNMVGMGHPPFTVADSDLAVNYSNAGRWEHLADPYDDESPAGAVDNDNTDIVVNNGGGSMIPALANSLLQTCDFPIAFVPSAKDGSSLYSQWAYRNPSNHYDTSTLYGQSITKAQRVGGVEIIIMHQGEADTSVHRTEAQYESDFATLIGHYRQDLYATIPIFICQLGTITIQSGDTRTDADIVAVRNAQHDLDNGADIFMSATAMDQPRIDHVHYSVAGLNVIGQRMAQTIKYYFGATTYYRGPAITSASFVDANCDTVDVDISHRAGDDLTPASGITGFSLLSNGSEVNITSAARMSANWIRLTLASAIPQGTTTTLRYLWGSNPNTNGLVKDNSSLALPLENTTADVTVSDLQPTQTPNTLTPTSTPTHTPTNTPTQTPTPTNTPTQTPTNTPTLPPTNTPTPTGTPEPTVLGDVNYDGLVDSTDALIILSADVGLNTSQFCPMNCGDVNGDGYVDSTDALIILSYDVGMSVPFPIGQPGCPSSVTQPPGCSP